VKACLPGQVLFDMSSMGGGEATCRTARAGKPVSSSEATTFGLVRVAGRWRISEFRFNLKYIEGSKELETTG
jgi:hypothetical protein